MRKKHPSKLKYTVLQLPFYYDDIPLADKIIENPERVKIIGSLGSAGFIEYCHKYNIAVQYWTVDNTTDILELRCAGADAIMLDHPERAIWLYSDYAVDAPLTGNMPVTE